MMTLSLSVMKSESAACLKPCRCPVVFVAVTLTQHIYFDPTGLPQVWNSNAVKDEFMGQVVLSGSVKDSSDPQRLQLRKQGRQMADEMPGHIGLRIVTATQLTAIWPQRWPERGQNVLQRCVVNISWNSLDVWHHQSANTGRVSTCLLLLDVRACEQKCTLIAPWWIICKVERWTDWMSISVILIQMFNLWSILYSFLKHFCVTYEIFLYRRFTSC